MDIQALNKTLGNIDLYLLDQILKGRFNPSMKVLDAGCGEGRNLTYFLNNEYEVFGIDRNPGAIRMLKFIASSLRPDIKSSNFQVATVEELPFEDNAFDLVLCNAVLHFARNHNHFLEMFDQLCRVLKPGGFLFIRTASSIGLEDKVVATENGCYDLPNGSNWYLIDRKQVLGLVRQFSLKLIEPLKTVNVDDQRCMSTLIFKKTYQSEEQ